MTALRRITRLELATPETTAERDSWRRLTAEYRDMSDAELDGLIRATLDPDPRWLTMTAAEIDEQLRQEMAGFQHPRSPR